MTPSYQDWVEISKLSKSKLDMRSRPFQFNPFINLVTKIAFTFLVLDRLRRQTHYIAEPHQHEGTNA